MTKLSDLPNAKPNTFCCNSMMMARSFDGPFYNSHPVLGPPTRFGIAVFKFTPSGKNISNAAGARLHMEITFCPFCGKQLSPKRRKTHAQC